MGGGKYRTVCRINMEISPGKGFGKMFGSKLINYCLNTEAGYDSHIAALVFR